MNLYHYRPQADEISRMPILLIMATTNRDYILDPAQHVLRLAPSPGPLEAMYSTPLMLRWIARCTSDWIRSGIDARSRPAGAFISALPPTADVWCAAVSARREFRSRHQRCCSSRSASP